MKCEHQSNRYTFGRILCSTYSTSTTNRGVSRFLWLTECLKYASIQNPRNGITSKERATLWTSLHEVLSLKNLSKNQLWFNGPDILRTNNTEVEPIIEELDMDNSELKPTTYNMTIPVTIIKYERFSKWTKLVGAMAWVVVFSEILWGRKELRTKNSLTLEEQTRAKTLIYKQMQGEVYRDEISQPKVGKKIAKNSQIANLDPFLDKEAI